MLLTTALLFSAMRDVWGWSALVAALVSGPLLLLDLAFFSANILKVREGGDQRLEARDGLLCRVQAIA